MNEKWHFFSLRACLLSSFFPFFQINWSIDLLRPQTVKFETVRHDEHLLPLFKTELKCQDKTLSGEKCLPLRTTWNEVYFNDKTSWRGGWMKNPNCFVPRIECLCSETGSQIWSLNHCSLQMWPRGSFINPRAPILQRSGRFWAQMTWSHSQPQILIIGQSVRYARSALRWLSKSSTIGPSYTKRVRMDISIVSRLLEHVHSSRWIFVLL